MKVKFCGAAQEVTGSSHLLTLDSGLTILLDCGLYQGGAEDMEGFNREWLFDPSTIDILIVSHAHIDHTGRIPKLIRDGFNGRIYSTHATRSLCSLMLMDSARIQEYDAKYARRKKLKDRSEPLYTTKDAKKALDLFEGLSFEHWHQIDDHVRIFLRDTGHILGSASVTLEIKENDEIKRFGFTGDIGRPNRPILKDPAPMPEVDYLISESTYGNKEHTSAPAELDEFLDIITKVCIENKGKLIIPAFSVGRTQEIVYMLDQLSTERSLPRISVYVDSPLAVNATEVFRIHPECFDDQLIEYMQEDPNPFGFDHLFYIRHAKDSKLINDINEPAIIISSYPGIRAHLTGTRYLASNPKLFTIGVGKLEAAKAMKTGFVVSLIISVTFPVIAQVLNDQKTWYGLVAGVGVAIGISSGVIALGGSLIAGSAIAPLITPSILIGLPSVAWSFNE